MALSGTFFSWTDGTRRRAGCCPGGIQHRVELITCTKCRVPEFPFGLRAAISQSTKDVLHVPLVPPAIDETLKRNKFVRAAAHGARLIDDRAACAIPAGVHCRRAEPASGSAERPEARLLDRFERGRRTRRPSGVTSVMGGR